MPSGTPAGFTLGGASDNNLPYGANLLLGPLANNGGRTLTHLPQLGSPLANAGSNALVPPAMTTDQRGPGFPRVVGPAVDVGSVETAEVERHARVARVYVNAPGLGDDAAFAGAAGYVAPFGVPVPAGAAQLRPIPWVQGVSQVAIQFDQDVIGQIGQADLSVRGSTSAYSFSGFSYDPGTRTALWTLAGGAVTRDRLRLVLDDAGLPGFDGEWANGQSNFPSGNGAAGGDFDFRLDVLAADANGDGVVNALDLADVKRRLTRRAGDGVVGPAAYSVFADPTANGLINALDVAALKARLNRRLPDAEPAAA